MKKWIPVIVAVVVIVLGLGWFLRRGMGPGAAVDLLEQFPAAEKRSLLQPPESAFTIEEVGIGIDETIDLARLDFSDLARHRSMTTSKRFSIGTLLNGML